MTDLDRLDVLAAAATPGPWLAKDRDIFLGVTAIEDEGESWEYVHSVSRIYNEGGHTAADADFIAACDPATIRSLVAAVRERDELRALVRQEHAVVAPPPYTEYHLANCPVPAALHSKDGADE